MKEKKLPQFLFNLTPALALLVLAPFALAGYQEFPTSGSYSFTVPYGVTQIFVTGSGPGGYGHVGGQYNGGGGGGSGAFIKNQSFIVVPGSVIPITIGGYANNTIMGTFVSLAPGQDGTIPNGGLGGIPVGIAGENGSPDPMGTFSGGGGIGGFSPGLQVPGDVGYCIGPNAYYEYDCYAGTMGSYGGGGGGGGGVYYDGRGYSYEPGEGGEGFLEISWVNPTFGTINITSNNPAASWTLSGPVVLGDSGVAQTYNNLPTGMYDLSWNAIPGFNPPADPAVLLLAPDGNISFPEGVYTPIVAPTVDLNFN